VDVFAYGQVREECRFLKHDADAAGLRWTPDALRGVAPGLLAETDRAGVGTLQPRNLTQDRGLAGRRRTEQDEHRSWFELDVEPRVDRKSTRKPLIDGDVQRPRCRAGS